MAVTDLRDIRVLTPRVRRAIDGPAADSPSSPAASLTDDQVKDLTADSIADLILYTGGVFGKSLVVVSRDSEYQAPDEWRTSAELNSNETAVIAAQSALTYHFSYLRDRKVSERIANEAQEWEWSISANTLRDHLRALQDARDKALEALMADNPTLDGYESFLAVRDAATSLAIEPWVDNIGGAIISDTRPGFQW